MKKIIVLSAVTLALILQGCGSNSKSSSGDAPKTTVSNELKSFAKGLTDNKDMTSMVKKSSSSSSSSQTEIKAKIYQKESIESCKDGGTIKTTSDTDLENENLILEQIRSGGLEVTIATDECIEDGVKSNGSIALTVKSTEFDTMLLTFLEDTTFEDLESSELITVSKNSTIKIEEVSADSEKITESIKASSSTGESYESINLVYYDTMDSSYEISGKIVRDGVTYSVDEQYNSSKTPMVFENYEDLVSGTAKYYNEQNHHITITVVAKNQIKISVDTDNDGDIDEEETIAL